jgi:hypothetical protein
MRLILNTLVLCWLQEENPKAQVLRLRVALWGIAWQIERGMKTQAAKRNSANEKGKVLSFCSLLDLAAATCESGPS